VNIRDRFITVTDGSPYPLLHDAITTYVILCWNNPTMQWSTPGGSDGKIPALVRFRPTACL